METAKRFVQTYKQAPWRIQRQRAAIVLIAIILVALISGLMLHITIQTGLAGLQVQKYNFKQQTLERGISDLRSQYASLTSAERLGKRAAEMGFVPVVKDNVTYMPIPGYAGRKSSINTSNTSSLPEESGQIIKPAYTQSWSELLMQTIETMSKQAQAGVKP